MRPRLTRKDLDPSRCRVLSRGRWANADLYLFHQGESTWVVKDFAPCPPLIRETWGRLLIRREFGALSRLHGICGIPNAISMIDARAFCYAYIPGRTLREVSSEEIAPGFFPALETLVERMHQRNVVHLDLRNRRNILITESGTPALLDFQSSLNLDRLPPGLHPFLKEIDISGVYKLWKRKSPESMDARRQARLAAMNRKRGLWVLRGYPLGLRKPPRQ